MANINSYNTLGYESEAGYLFIMYKKKDIHLINAQDAKHHPKIV